MLKKGELEKKSQSRTINILKNRCILYICKDETHFFRSNSMSGIKPPLRKKQINSDEIFIYGLLASL
jgi:hypothetical protein